MPNYSNNFKIIIISVWCPIFPKNDIGHASQINKNDYLRLPSLYPSVFLIIDITSISGANLPNSFIEKKVVESLILKRQSFSYHGLV